MGKVVAHAAPCVNFLSREAHSFWWNALLICASRKGFHAEGRVSHDSSLAKTWRSV